MMGMAYIIHRLRAVSEWISDAVFSPNLSHISTPSEPTKVSCHAEEVLCASQTGHPGKAVRPLFIILLKSKDKSNSFLFRNNNRFNAKCM